MSTTARSARPAASSFSESVEEDGTRTWSTRVRVDASRKARRSPAWTGFGWKSSASTTRVAGPAVVAAAGQRRADGRGAAQDLARAEPYGVPGGRALYAQINSEPDRG